MVDVIFLFARKLYAFTRRLNIFRLAEFCVEFRLFLQNFRKLNELRRRKLIIEITKRIKRTPSGCELNSPIDKLRNKTSKHLVFRLKVFAMYIAAIGNIIYKYEVILNPLPNFRYGYEVKV